MLNSSSRLRSFVAAVAVFVLVVLHLRLNSLQLTLSALTDDVARHHNQQQTQFRDLSDQIDQRRIDLTESMQQIDSKRIEIERNILSLMTFKNSLNLQRQQQLIANNNNNNNNNNNAVTSQKFESEVSDRLKSMRSDLDKLESRWRELTERINAVENAAGFNSDNNRNQPQLILNNNNNNNNGNAGDNNKQQKHQVDPDPQTWIKDPARTQVIAALNSKVYDVTTERNFAARLDVLHDVHRELDQIVNLCACGSDGASNNDLQRSVYLNLSMTLRPTVICETGFNAGHAAAALLLGTRKRATYVGFDLMSRRYSKRTSLWLSTLFDSGTVQVIDGSSGLTAPRFFGAQTDAAAEIECDIVHIDGGRFQGMPLKDLRTFHLHSREGATVIMDDVQCDATNAHICREPGAAWKRLVQEGKIAGEQCFEKPEEGVHFCIGQFKHTHA